jgi:hypothetical protein
MKGGRSRPVGEGDLPELPDQLNYQWKSKFDGLSVSELKRNRELETENAKLKRMYADLALENTALRDLIEKKL